MKTTIDRAGRIVVPKAIREAIGLIPGTSLEIRVTDGRIELEPTPLSVKLERRGSLLVAVPQQSSPPLEEKEVESTISALREGRGQIER